MSTHRHRFLAHWRGLNGGLDCCVTCSIQSLSLPFPPLLVQILISVSHAMSHECLPWHSSRDRRFVHHDVLLQETLLVPSPVPSSCSSHDILGSEGHLNVSWSSTSSNLCLGRCLSVFSISSIHIAIRRTVHGVECRVVGYNIAF